MQGYLVVVKSWLVTKETCLQQNCSVYGRECAFVVENGVQTWLSLGGDSDCLQGGVPFVTGTIGKCWDCALWASGISWVWLCRGLGRVALPGSDIAHHKLSCCWGDVLTDLSSKEVDFTIATKYWFLPKDLSLARRLGWDIRTSWFT